MKHYLLSIFFIFVSISAFTQNIDIEILKSINLNRNINLDSFFISITNSVAILIFVLPISIFIWNYVNQKKRESLKKLIFIAFTLLTSSILITALKIIINRERPFVTFPFLEKISVGGTPSFPSGHTSDAFTLALVISLMYPKWYLFTPLFLWAALVGYSRMFCGVHYPSDVLAGMILAIIIVYSCYLIYKKYFKELKNNN